MKEQEKSVQKKNKQELSAGFGGLKTG